MATRDPNAWKISTKMEPNFEGGLLHNDFIQGTMFIKITKAQRNNIPALSRSLEGDNTTACLVINDNTIYKLVNNPVGNTTQDSDWEALPTASAGGSIIPIGKWDISNTAPVLQDSGAANINGQFYYVEGAPNTVSVTHTGLFLGNTVQVTNNDLIISVGTHWINISNATTWESLNRPQVIIDYENGIVIAHTHSISDIIGLSSALADKWDSSNLADFVLDFIDVPDAGIPDVAFLRKHFYDKENLYNRAEVNALLAGLAYEDPTFDGDRTIRKIPIVGDNPGKDFLGETIEEMFFGFIKPVDLLNPFSVAEVGSSATPQAEGYVDPKDASSITGNILIKDEGGNVGGTVVPNAAPAITVINQALNAKIIVAGTNQSYRLEYNYKKEVGDPDTLVQGPVVLLKGVYPFLYGMAATGLTGANIYTTLVKEISDVSTKEFSFTGTNQRVYIAYPETYGTPVSIKDQAGNELLGSLFSVSPVVLAVDSLGLTSNWSGVNYNVYESQYDVSLNNAVLFVYFTIQEGAINSLDDIPEGVTNKHFDLARRSKLDSITINPADIGDMKKADFISHYTGIVDHAAEDAIRGYNESGAPIVAGSYVKVVGWNVTENLSTWETADKDNNDDVQGFVESTILNGESGIITLRGANRILDTSAQIPGTIVYLGSNGGVLYAPPSSGSLLQVGTVIRQANPGIISSRKFVNLIKDQYIIEFRPNTKYLESGLCLYDDPVQGLIVLRAKTTFTTAGTINLADWDVLGSDMKRVVYDTNSNGIVDRSQAEVLEVINNTGATITAGKLVYVSGNDAIVGKAEIIVTSPDLFPTAGILIQDLADGEEGLIIVSGTISNLNTSSFAVNEPLYLSTLGNFTNVEPTSGLVQKIGYVLKSDVATGKIKIEIEKNEILTRKNLVDSYFSISGGNVVKIIIGDTIINELTQVVDYTLPLISGLSSTEFIINVKNGSGSNINLLTTNPDTLEGDSLVQLLSGENLTLYINGEYKIL